MSDEAPIDLGTTILSFQGTAGIEEAEHCLERFRAVAQGQPHHVVLDLEALEAVEVSFFQALVAFRQTLHRTGALLTVLPLPDSHPVVVGAQLLGLTGCLTNLGDPK